MNGFTIESRHFFFFRKHEAKGNEASPFSPIPVAVDLNCEEEITGTTVATIVDNMKRRLILVLNEKENHLQLFQLWMKRLSEYLS